jgi:hypothetical protein
VGGGLRDVLLCFVYDALDCIIGCREPRRWIEHLRQSVDHLGELRGVTRLLALDGASEEFIQPGRAFPIILKGDVAPPQNVDVLHVLIVANAGAAALLMRR